MRIKKSFLCAFILVLTTFFTSSLSAAERLRSLEDVDLVGVSAYVKDDVLKIRVSYKNRDSDELVFWREGTVSCHCDIFENIGTGSDKKKGQMIISIDKTLKSYTQSFYVDVPDEYLDSGKRAILECSVDTGYKEMNARDGISLDN